MASRKRVRYEYRHYGGEAIKLRQSKGGASIPVAKDENSSWKASAQADYDAIETTERFPNGRQMPNRLWDLGAGISYNRALEEGRALGVGFDVNSPSDRPFGNGRDVGFNLNATYKIPAEGENLWILFLSASTTRGFLNYVPLPGAAYVYKASDSLRLVIGLPFAFLLWTPAETLTVTFSYFPLRNAELRLGMGPRRGLNGYVMANFRARNFRLHGRTDKDERLFNEEGLAQAGVNIPLLGPAVMLEAGGGHAFARSYFLAQKANERGSAPAIKPGNASFGFAKLNLTF